MQISRLHVTAIKTGIMLATNNCRLF